MDHYIDICVLPDPEFETSTLMSALFSKLHRALVEVNSGDIGVSFPRAKKGPGNHLRLHSTLLSLERLMEQPWLKGLRDYTMASETKVVPDDVQYVCVQRVQSKLTASRLRRAVKRGSMTVDDAESLMSKREKLEIPFFQLNSLSTGQKFPLFVSQNIQEKSDVIGSFNSYGLSRNATVPWF